MIFRSWCRYMNRLVKIGLIRIFNDRGTRRYLLRDPRLAVVGAAS